MTDKRVKTELFAQAYECLSLADSQSLFEILDSLTTSNFITRIILVRNEKGQTWAWLVEGTSKYNKDQYWCEAYIEKFQWKTKNFSCIAKAYGYSEQVARDIKNIFWGELNQKGWEFDEFEWEAEKQAEKQVFGKETQPCQIVQVPAA